MNFDEYQTQARRTQNKALSLFDTRQHALFGLASEVGEIHGLFQKQKQGHVLDETALRLEIGDVLWFLSELCDVYGWYLEDIAIANIQKLRNRYPKEFSPEQSINRDENKRKGAPEKTSYYSRVVKGNV